MIPFLVWASISLVAIIVEIFTCRLYAVWITLGGIVAIILYAVGLEWYFSLVGFIVVSVLCLIFLRKIALKKFEELTKKRNEKRQKKFVSKFGDNKGVFSEESTALGKEDVCDKDTSEEIKDIEQSK